MKKHRNTTLGIALGLILVAVTAIYLSKQHIPVLQPAGTIASKERQLIIFGAALSLAIVIPVFTLLGVFAYKYRETSKKAKYTPSLGGSKLAETVWWIVPTVLIVAISIATWQSSYALDPYKPLVSKNKTLRIQVISLDWKWLFIYPDQHVAAVNEVTIPENTPVDFEITSDSVMNSLWIPNLGGQMYAMPGMVTNLNLAGTKLGTYSGRSANISGVGFADMKFPVHVIRTDLFPQWTKSMRVDNESLTSSSYAELAKPGVLKTGELKRYSSVTAGLFDTVTMKYMMPQGTVTTGEMQ